jgi:hypothetical protein
MWHCIIDESLPIVLNPMIKMTWIRKQWEAEYIDMAEEMVMDEVSTRFI